MPARSLATAAGTRLEPDGGRVAADRGGAVAGARGPDANLCGSDVAARALHVAQPPVVVVDVEPRGVLEPVTSPKTAGSRNRRSIGRAHEPVKGLVV